METILVVTVDSWQGSKILWPRIDSERATTKPMKFLQDSESWNRRRSSGEWIFLEGDWNWYGVEMVGTSWDFGTGARMMAWELLFGGRLTAGALFGR